MNRKDLLREMKDSIGNKDPIEFFAKFVDVFDVLFDRMEVLETELKESKRQASLARNNAALAIRWEPFIAADMISKEIEVLRKDKEHYTEEISALKKAYNEGKVTQDYVSFVTFWWDLLGWHPFLDY